MFQPCRGPPSPLIRGFYPADDLTGPLGEFGVTFLSRAITLLPFPVLTRAWDFARVMQVEPVLVLAADAYRIRPPADSALPLEQAISSWAWTCRCTW